LSNLAISDDKLPVVLPSSVARVTADGKPTKQLVDWEQLTRNWYKVNAVALDKKLTEVSSTLEDPTTGLQAVAKVTEDLSTAVGLEGAVATKITGVEAKYNSATANGQIGFAAKAGPAGSIAAYGLYLTAGNVFTGLEAVAASDGTSYIALKAGSVEIEASEFKLTDAGTAQNVFNYTGGVFTFNVPVQIGTTDILAGAINAPAAMTANNTLTVGDTGGGWTTIASVSASGASGYVALVHADFEYRLTPGWSGFFDGEFRIVRNDGAVLYGPSSLFNYANYATVSISRLATGFNAEYTYSLQVNLDLNGTSGGTPGADFRRRGIMIDLRKR
jgi:hypothetical protein